LNIVSNIKDWQEVRKSLQDSIGFVPTMGNLHDGHASLFKKAKAENNIVVASIFVNPTQFNDVGDFEKYQRTLKADYKLLEELGVDFVLVPEKDDIYPENYEVQLVETTVSNKLEGEFRSGHFTGMLTIVLKLLNLVRASRAYFGEKDFQQLILIKKMVNALFLPVEIIACPIVRAESGLALSSRNARLSLAELKKAAILSLLLKSSSTDDEIKEELERQGFRPEYVVTKWGRRLAAAWLGDVRLIDTTKFSNIKKD